MPRYIDGIDIERVYRVEEIMDMYYRGRLRPVALRGYVVRADADGTVRFVHWTSSTANRLTPGSQNPDGSEASGLRTYVQTKGDWQEDMRRDLEEQHPMRRTTPQQKVARLALRIMAEARRSGIVGGLTDEQIREITGEAWRNGQTDLTMDMVRRVAAHFLGVGETTNKEADRKRVTRKHALA